MKFYNIEIKTNSYKSLILDYSHKEKNSEYLQYYVYVNGSPIMILTFKEDTLYLKYNFFILFFNFDKSLSVEYSVEYLNYLKIVLSFIVNRISLKLGLSVDFADIFEAKKVIKNYAEFQKSFP